MKCLAVLIGLLFFACDSDNKEPIIEINRPPENRIDGETFMMIYEEAAKRVRRQWLELQSQPLRNRLDSIYDTLTNCDEPTQQALAQCKKHFRNDSLGLVACKNNAIVINESRKESCIETKINKVIYATYEAKLDTCYVNTINEIPESYPKENTGCHVYYIVPDSYSTFEYAEEDYLKSLEELNRKKM